MDTDAFAYQNQNDAGEKTARARTAICESLAVGHSQRNTRDDTAVQMTKINTSATMSVECASHVSPRHIPRRSETEYVSGSAFANPRSAGGITLNGMNRPDNASIGYRK